MFENALLVLIEETGQARIEAGTLDLPAMALRTEQTAITQLLFLNVKTNTIDTLALLHDEQPWITNSAGAYIPHVVDYMPLLEPIEIDAVSLNHAETLGCLPTIDIEPIEVDPDELEIDPNYLGSQIVDEMIMNRRSVNHEATKRQLINQKASQFESVRNQLARAFGA